MAKHGLPGAENTCTTENVCYKVIAQLKTETANQCNPAWQSNLWTMDVWIKKKIEKGIEVRYFYVERRDCDKLLLKDSVLQFGI